MMHNAIALLAGEAKMALPTIPAQNKERCRCHSKKNEIDSHCKVQNLAICPRTGDYDCRYTLKDDRDYRRSRSSRQFTDALKEKPVAGHRVVHARSGQHALAEESECRDCDSDGNPFCPAFPQCDPHHIRSRNRCCVEAGRTEDTQTCEIDCKVEPDNSGHAQQQPA